MITRSAKNRAIFSAVTAGVSAGCIGTLPVALSAEIEEIVVTATKQQEGLQDVGVTVNTLSESNLDDQQIKSFSDYILATPGITAGGRGPGQNEIYIRGATVDAINITVSEAQGAAPNVALYLDEQPVTAGGRNLDVYVADMSRIEVLPGPQGTLFGSSSQAGTVRLITNKPAIDEFELGTEAASSFTSGGSNSTKLEAMINVPVIENKLAVRAVAFNDKQGGYIDNVLSDWTPNPSLNSALPSMSGIQFVPAGGSPTAHEFADGTYAEPGKVYPVAYTTVSNDELVEDNHNTAEYSGFRAGAMWQINEDWDLLMQHHQQTVDVKGNFQYEPQHGELNVSKFFPEQLEDTFGQTSWTLEGRLEKLDLIYTGGYLNRNVDHVHDYSDYVNVGGYIPGYICEYNTPGYHGGGGVGYSYDPTLSGDPAVIECTEGRAFTKISNENERWTHELRIHSDINDSLSLTAGVFFQDRLVGHIGDFGYLGTSHWPSLNPAGISVGKANNKSTRSPSVQFANDILRVENELAVFGELTWYLTERFSTVIGMRQYNSEIGFEGFSAFRYGSRPVPNLAGEPGVNPNPTGVGGRDYASNLGDFQPLEVDDLINKIGFSFEATDDLLLYGSLSEGYRPAGFNRAAAAGVATAEGVAARANDGPGGFPDYFIPLIFDSDTTTNAEFGWKFVGLDRRIRMNGSVYYIDWKDIQVSHFDSANISIFTIVDNGGDAVIRGFETHVEFWASPQLSLFGGISLNNTELTRVNPAFAFVIADEGSELPLTPKLQLSGRARYEWDKWGETAFWQLSGNYASKSFNSLVDTEGEPRIEQDAWLMLNGSIGINSGDGWGLELFMNNITDERPQLHTMRQYRVDEVTTARPRTIGVRMKYAM